MNILLIAWFDPKGPNAVIDHIQGIKSGSRHSIDVFNTFNLNYRIRKFFKKMLYRYDGVLLHNTVTYDVESTRRLNNLFSPSLEGFTGIKILMKQDEMRRVNSIKQLLKDWNISVLTTCLDSINVKKVYGDSLNKIKVVHTLTGYVKSEYINFERIPLSDRPLDVVYRGMDTPFEWGRLGYEKKTIGEEFQKRTQEYGLKVDISSKNSDRIYGKAWIDFLSSSRATLAVESGASIFDFDGSIEKQSKEFKDKNPEVTFEDAYSAFLKPHEGLIYYNQISPRHIEAAYIGTVQIMYEGKYSDIFVPDRHYISLKKDFSNLEDVILRLRDTRFCNQLINNTINEVLVREDLTFKYFIQKIDDAISEII